jgi:hypothetical protein
VAMGGRVGWRAEGATEEAKAAEALGPCLVDTEGGEGETATAVARAAVAVPSTLRLGHGRR